MKSSIFHWAIKSKPCYFLFRPPRSNRSFCLLSDNYVTQLFWRRTASLSLSRSFDGVLFSRRGTDCSREGCFLSGHFCRWRWHPLVEYTNLSHKDLKSTIFRVILLVKWLHEFLENDFVQGWNGIDTWLVLKHVECKLKTVRSQTAGCRVYYDFRLSGRHTDDRFDANHAPGVEEPSIKMV